MNYITTVLNGISARLFAGIIIVSLLLTAFPAAFFVAEAATQNVTIGVSMHPNPTAPTEDHIIFSNPNGYSVTLEQLELVDSTSSFFGPQDLIIPANASSKLDVGTRLNQAADDITFSGTNVTTHTISYSGGTAEDNVVVSGSLQVTADDGIVAACSPQFDSVSATTDIQNNRTGDYFDSVNDALADCDTQAGDEIDILGDITALEEILITKDNVTLDGNGNTVSVDFNGATLGNNNSTESNSVIDVSVDGGSAAINTIIKDVVIAVGGTYVHGINLYNTQGIVIDGVTVTDAGKAAVTINSTEATIIDITTSGSAWYAINVDQKVTGKSAELTINQTSAHAENSPTTPHMFIDDATKLVSIDDVDSQYDILPIGDARVYTLKTPVDEDVPVVSDIKMYVERNGAYEESYVVRPGDNARVAVTAVDDGSGIKDVEFRVKQGGAGGYVAARTFVATSVGGDVYHFEYQVPTDGKYIDTHQPINQTLDANSFWARATDNAGNYHHGLSGTFTFDTVVPEMQNITMFVKQGGVFVESNVVEPGDDVRIEVEATDLVGPIRDVEFRIQAQDGQYVALRDYVATPVGGGVYHFEYQVPTDGKYVNTHNPMNEDVDGHKFWARATDEAGNYNHGLKGDFTFRQTVVVEPVEPCHLPYVVDFGPQSDDATFSTTAGDTGLVIEEMAGGYTIGLYDDGRSGVYRVQGTIVFPAGTDTSTFTFTEPALWEGLEQTHGTYPDVADLVANEIEFDLYVNGANDIFTIINPALENPANCDVDTPVLPTPYCGDGERNQDWEMCEVGEEGCTDYCTLDNQCSDLRLVNLTLDETESTSFDGSLHLGSAGSVIPNGTWFNFVEVGDQSFVTTANAVEGLAIERNQTDGTLGLAFVGGNKSRATDVVAGTIMTVGVGLGVIDRTPNPGFKLEDGSGSSFDDVFDKDGENINFDLRADTGNDGVTVQMNMADEEYNCPACLAGVEARIVLDSYGQAGAGQMNSGVLLGDGTRVDYGEWFPLIGDDVGTFITDAENATNFTDAETTDGLFVSRNGDGTMNVVLVGEHQSGGNTNHEWIIGTVEVRDAEIASVVELSGDFKFESHNNAGVPSNDGFDDLGTPIATEIGFKMWADTASDGFKVTIDAESIVYCEDDTIDVVPAALAITSPAVEFEQLSGVHTFTADYSDDDETVDLIQWAIRPGMCEISSINLAGNVGGLTDVSDFTDTTFSADVDMTTWEDGEYCFIINPREQSGEENLRETRTFVLANPRTPEPDMFRITGTKYEVAESGTTTYAGWTINLVGTDRSTTTDANGEYYFDVEAGDWEVEEIILDDWTQVRVEQNENVREADESGVATCSFSPGEENQFLTTRLAFVVNPESYDCDFYNKQDEVVVEPETEDNNGGSSSGTRTDRRLAPAPLGQVLGASTDSCPFLIDYLQMGTDNDSMEVMKLQSFLHIFRSLYGGTENPITGNFGIITDTNVKRFQETYKAEILEPWFNQGIVGHTKPTGFVYKTTLWKINDIVCPDSAVLPDLTGETLQSNVDLNAVAVQD